MIERGFFGSIRRFYLHDVRTIERKDVSFFHIRFRERFFAFYESVDALRHPTNEHILSPKQHRFLMQFAWQGFFLRVTRLDELR